MVKSESENGIVTIASKHSVDDTVGRLKRLLEAKAVKTFAVVDHSGEAGKAGLDMPNTKLVIFGNPRAGTPLMLAAPALALDLPLKILVWEDADAKVWVTYTCPEFLSKRHNLAPDLIKPLAAVSALAAEIAG